MCRPRIPMLSESADVRQGTFSIQIHPVLVGISSRKPAARASRPSRQLCVRPFDRPSAATKRWRGTATLKRRAISRPRPRLSFSVCLITVDRWSEGETARWAELAALTMPSLAATLPRARAAVSIKQSLRAQRGHSGSDLGVYRSSATCARLKPSDAAYAATDSVELTEVTAVKRLTCSFLFRSTADWESTAWLATDRIGVACCNNSTLIHGRRWMSSTVRQLTLAGSEPSNQLTLVGRDCRSMSRDYRELMCAVCYWESRPHCHWTA